jgi:hypothetical protein
MSRVHIEYRFQLKTGETQIFRQALDSETFDLETEPVRNPPSWTALAFKQCPHCPLDEETHPQCPVALQLYRLVSRFEDTKSIDPVKLMVVTAERRVAQKLDLQHALASILDLVLPTCGCPKTAYLKPLARFHLPLASEEEHVFRITGMYLLAQYFLGRGQISNQTPFAGLAALYKDLHQLNAAVASRLQFVTESDSVKNAIALIDVYSMLVPLLLEEQLSEMRGFFDAYLQAEEAKAETSYFVEAKSFLADSEEGEGLPEWLKSVAAIKEDEAPDPRPRPKATHRTRSRGEAEPKQRQDTESTPEPGKPPSLEEILSRSTLSLEPIELKEEDDEEEQDIISEPPQFNRFGGSPQR